MDNLYSNIEKRGCGPCCAASAIHALTGRKVHVEDLFEDVGNRGGFTKKGAIHYVLAEVISEYGLKAYAAAFDRDAIHASLPDAVFICSVTHKFPIQENGGHLVLLHGLADSQASFMDPSAWGLDHSKLPIDRFFGSYSGRAIRIDPPTHIPGERHSVGKNGATGE